MRTFLRKKNRRLQLSKNSSGFTLMEIMVATMIFAIVTVSLLSLFNYVLKINRRSEALRQASQGMRSFMEFLVKEIRNGQIDYYVSNGNTVPAFSATSPCSPPASVGANTYHAKDNYLGIINTDNVQECFYYANSGNVYIDGASPVTFTTPGVNLVLEKAGVSGKQVLNPPNFQVQALEFLIRPLCDPYSKCVSYAGDYPHIQPAVTIIAKFLVSLPTGETSTIYYQTSVSSVKYDIP